MNAVEMKRQIATEAMTASGLTQEQIAERMGITQAYISKIKRGNAPLERVLELVETCGKTLKVHIAQQ